MVALLLALVATMTPFVADPDRAHAQTAASITVGGKAVSGFALGTYDYTANPITGVERDHSHTVSASAVSGSRVHSIRYAHGHYCFYQCRRRNRFHDPPRHCCTRRQRAAASE